MWNSHRIMSAKNFIIKKSAKVFPVCVSMTCDRFILELRLVLALRCYCGDTDLFQNTCFKETTIWRLKNSHSNDKLLEKIVSFSYHIEEKIHRSKLHL